MGLKEENTEYEVQEGIIGDAQKEVPNKKNGHWQNQLWNKGLINNMPYLIFLTFLAIIYIGNNNYAIELIKELNIKKKQAKEAHWQYMDLQSRLMFQTSENRMKIKTEMLGLQPLKYPAFKIKIKQKEN